MAGEVIGGRYELVELIGTGGMSSVHKAHDRMLERYVALKLLHPQYIDDAEYVERFRREARAVAQLSHPNIVTVIDRGEDDGQQFIVFEYVDGENLKQLVERSGPLPVRRAIELALAIADGLAFAHGHGLVHRDVKPQNVLLTSDGETKVTDFGIARSLGVERGVTQTGTVLGTGDYLAPEQANGGTVTPATDVYSLGVVLYELLTGAVPFSGDTFVAVALKHLHEPVPDLAARRPDLPPRLVGVVDRALEKDPHDRFASMDELAHALRRCLAELDAQPEARTVVTRRPVAAGQPRGAREPWRPRKALLVVLAVLAVAAAAAGIVVGLQHDSSSSTPPADASGTGGGGGTAVLLRGVATVDPAGDGEHDDQVSYATDGNPSTYWETQSYYNGGGSLGKPGVGIVLDAGRPVAARTLTVTTDTPGFTAEVRTGSSPTGAYTGFTPSSQSQTVGSRTTFALEGHTARYYLLWITNLGPHQSVHVNEVTATS